MMRQEINCKAKLLCFLVGEGICCMFIYTGLWNIPCFFERFFHIPCLGCGMTQATLWLLRGKLTYAIQFHPFVLPFVFLMIIIHVAIVLYLFDRKAFWEWMKIKLLDRRLAVGSIVLWLVRIWLYG